MTIFHKMIHIKKIAFSFLFILAPMFSWADLSLEQLVNKTHDISWYMFQVRTTTQTRTYLANNRDSTEPNGIRVWNFTADRLWRPIHNANSFDAFSPASKNFDTISMDSEGKTITFGSKTISKNILIDNYLEELANKTHTISWYYWVTASGYAFLAFNRDDPSGERVYEHAQGGKWRPVHNANAFDGYPAADAIFSNVEISEDGRQITLDFFKFNIPVIENILPRETVIDTFKITSNDLSDEDYKSGTNRLFSDNPHLNWSGIPTTARTLAIEIINLDDGKALWRVVNIALGDADSSYMPANADVDYKNMLTLENDYDFTKTFYEEQPIGHFIITVYAVEIRDVTTMRDAKIYSSAHANMLFKMVP